MGKRVSCLLGLLLFFLLQYSLLAQEYTPAEYFDYEVVDGKVVITDYNREPDQPFTVSIPPQIDGMDVVAIGDWAFEGFFNLTAVTLPEGVTSIGEGAFEECGSLAAVNFPASLTSIGVDAFADTGLTEVQITAGITSIGEKAFSGCANLASITVSADNPNYSSSEDGILFDRNKTVLIQYPRGKAGTSYVVPASVLRIGVEAFANCGQLTAVTLNEGLLSLEMGAFVNCWALEQINVPASLTTIGEEPFAFCNSLLEVILPENPSLASIEAWAFEGCGMFTEVELPDTVVQIGEGAFADCWRLEEIIVGEGNPALSTLDGVLFDRNKTRLIQYPAGKQGASYVVPATVTVIGGGAFDNCQNLTSVEFPGGVTSIGEEAFANCFGLTSINLPASLITLGVAAFEQCQSLSSITFPASLKQIPNRCFMNCQELVDLDLPEGLESIGKQAFMGCTISEITLPASLISLGEQVFAGVLGWQTRSPLSEYRLAPGNTAFLVHEGVLYSADGKTLIDCPQGKTGSYQLRPGTETIAPYAFSKSGLDGFIVIPASVTTIAENAFAWSGWMDPILQEAYFAGAPPTIFEPEEDDDEDGFPGFANNYSLTFVYGSDQAAAWQAVLSWDGSLDGFPVRELPGGALALPGIARQDGIIGEYASCFNGTLNLIITADSSDPEGITLYYRLDGGEPDAESLVVPGNGILTLDGSALLSVAPYRNGLLCGPVIQQNYLDMSEISDALSDQGVLEFITTPHAPWAVVQDNDYNGQPGEQAVSSTAGTFARPSQLQTTVTGPGCLVFWWRSNDYWDHKEFSFLDNETVVFSLSGETAWMKMRYQVPAGEHTLTWQSADQESGWNYDSGDFQLDQISWYPGENLGFLMEDDGESARVTDYLGDNPLALVPEQSGDGLLVTDLDQWAFNYNTTLKGVLLPENLVVPQNAFRYCPVLNSLFFQGLPPGNYLEVGRWTTLYYPIDRFAEWSAYIDTMANWYGRVCLPISYPLASPPEISRQGGELVENPDCFAGTVSVLMNASEPGAVVCYTTDGSIPTAESMQFGVELILTKTTTLTARVFRLVDEVLQPCSAISRRTFVNPADFNQAVGVDVDTITFTTDGDVPWKIYTRNNALGVQTEVVGTGPVFPGQRSTLYGTFTLQEEGIFAYKQYNRNRYFPYEWRLYDQAGQPVGTTESGSYLGNNWYRFTMTLGNGNPLPPGTYTMVWSIDIPVLAINYQDQESYHSCFLDDFSVGSMTAPLTVLCNPPEGGRIYADGVEGSSFNKFIGQNVTLQVTENENYLFQKWQDSNTNEWYRNIVIKDPELDGVNANTYTANFVQAAFVMAVAQPGEGGSVSGGYQKYALGSEVYLNAYPNTGWRFDRWSDDDQLPETDPIPASRSFTCTAEHHNQTFTAQFVRCITVTGQALYPNPNNPGWWYSGGGTITGTGVYDVADPATPVLVTLTATPTNENFAFLGWDDNNNRIIDPEESTAPTRELSLTWADTKNYHAIALFQQTALVIVNYYQEGDDALGEITITSGEAVLPLEDFLEGRRLPVGTVLNLTGTANEHCRFNNWWQNWYGWNYTVAGNPLQITVSPENVNTYYADFAQLVPVEVVFAPGTPAGCSAQVLLNGVDQGLYSWQEIGAALELRASCPANYRAQWEGTNFHTIYIFVNADPLENVYPVEFIPTYSVHLATSPDPCPGGYVTPVSQTIDLGTESSFYAGTNWGEYWRFVRWSDAVTDSSRTFNPAESGTYSFTALFERYVTIACQGESSNYGYHYSDFDGDGDLAVTDVPRQVTVTALPGDGFRFDRWTDDAAASLPDATNPVRVLNVSTADTYIGLKANFVKTQRVTVAVKPGSEAWGTISSGALDNAPVDYDSEITFTATANPNCQFLGWTDYITEATRTETVSYDVTYLAEFASQAPVNIRIQEGQEGWGCQAGIVGPDNQLTPSGPFPVGVWQTLEARPAANHRFVRWSDGYYWATRSFRLTDQGFEVTAIFAQTANLTLDFQTDPAVLPEGIVIPNWYCYLNGSYRTPGTYVVDVGDYTLNYYVYGNWIAPAAEQISLTVGENRTLTKIFTLITTGTVTGYLNPSSLTGKWRIKDTENWLDSNTTLTLQQGSYDIEFQPVSGWLTPAGQTITINPNRHTSFNGTYSEIVPGVELTFSPSEVSEAAGPSATIATLRRVALDGNPIDLTKSLTVYLSVSENNALILPASSILIPAGRSLTQFPVGVVDNAVQEDFLQDGNGNDIARGRQIILSGRVAMSSSCNCSGLPTNGSAELALEASLVIWDNDSPALSVSVSPSTLPERDEVYLQALTVTRNEEVPGAAVQVELSAFITDKNGVSKLDTGLDELGNPVGTEIEFWKDGVRLPFRTEGDPSVSLVTIPEGQASVKVDLLARNDGKVDGNQVVSIFADADAYAPGSGWVMVSDLSFPDYRITNVATPGTVLESDSTHFLQVSLSNNGNMDTPSGLSIPVAIHASRSDASSSQTLLLSTQVLVTAEQPLPKNGTLDLTFEVVLSNLFPADDWRFSVVVNPQNTLREVSNLNNQTWSGRFSVNAGYVPQLDAPPAASILPNESMQLTGFVSKSLENPVRVPDVPVEVYFVCGEYRRILQATSGVDGTFSVNFVPAPTEIGRIIAGSCYPGTQTNVKQQEFDVLGFKYNAGSSRYLQWDLTVNTAKEYTLTLNNPNAAALTGIEGGIIDAQGNPEADVQLQFSNLPGTLAGLTSQSVTFQITATAPSPGRDYERPVLRFSSTEGARLDIPVYLYAIPQFASLALNPVSIDTTMQIGVARQIEVTLSNQGAIETGPVTVTVPVLSWLTLPSGGSMPSIPAGGSATITIELKGDQNTELGAPLSGAIAINAVNAQNGARLPFRATAVSDDKGSLQVTAMDEFTFNTVEKPNLKNATVTVKNPYTGAVLATGDTGDTGVCLLENLPVGKCQVIVSADKHENNTQLADIAPGGVVKLDAFLAYQAITYSWEVVPTEIEDEYEVVLNVVYETNVPMPVVETSMPTSFIDMEPGTVRMVNAILTNKGLINANEVRLDIANTANFTFECSQPDNGFTLLPMQSFVVPIIVRRAAATRSADCYTRAVTVYYYECGPDRKWHRYEKKVDLTYCPGTSYSYTPGGYGPGGPGVPYRDTASVVTPSLPPAPSVPESCVPCQNGLLNAAFKCGIGFVPGVGCVSGIVDALGSMYNNYNKGAEGWNDIITSGALAGLGCAAEGTAAVVGNVLSCIKGFMEACNGLDGQPPVPFPYPGGFAPSPSGTRSALTRAVAASWMEELQDKMYWGYRQGADHAAAMEEFYGAVIWLECEAPQLNAFNQAFGQLSKKRDDGSTPVVPEEAPELLAVLPVNLDSDHLAAFVARWNRTMAYWASLPGGEGAEVPGGTDGNGDSVINLQKLLGIRDDMLLCEDEAQNLGYADVNALVDTMYAEAQEYGKTSSSVCAKISLEIKQKITMTREAFEGTLTMSNGHETLPIEQIGLVLKVTDAGGNDCTHLFEIQPVTEKFNGISAVDGSGVLGAKATGSAVVRFIPERDAAPETPAAYNFGGTLTYKNPFSGLVAVVDLTPVTLTVNPSPSLQIHYFLQRDILGDDPLTLNTVEPSYPAELSALVFNNGYGEAKNFRIDSGQPKITDNQKGLLIDFSLWDYQTEQSMLNGTPNTMPLGQVNLGNIAPKSSGLAQWWLTSSLLGHFVGMEASYSHLSSNGNPDLSLIESVSIHELIRSGFTLDGQEVVFLVNDEVDAQDVPDTLWFEADASSAPVLSVNHQVSTPPVLNALDSPATYEFGITVELEGWHYIHFDDPGTGRYEIMKTQRDGVELPFRNCWLTDRTLPDGQDPVYEDILHLLDYLTPGTYSYVVTVSKLPVESVEVAAFEAFSSNAENVEDYILTGDIDAITVRFNTPIDPATFSSADLILRRQGVLVGADELQSKIVITPDAGDPENLTYILSGFGTITNQDGFYVLTVQCAGIADPEGYFGKAGQQLMWIRQHDFAGGPPPAPGLLSLERIIPEAGMEGEFDVRLTFLGNIKPDSVTLAGFRLKRNGAVLALDGLGLSIVSSPEPGVFLLKGLGTLDAENNFFSLLFDASTVEDMQGTAGAGTRSVAWGTDATPPAAVTGLTLTPDSGLNAADRVLMLGAAEQLQLTGTLPERPCSWQLLYRADGAPEWSNLTAEIYVPEDGSTALAHSFNLPQGTWNLLLRVWDEARNSTDNPLDVTIDNTPPAALLNPGITPDSGIFAADRITALAEGASLAFTGTVPETPCRLQITCKPDGGSASAPVTLNFAAAADASFNVDFGALAAGRYLVGVLLTDLAGNQTQQEVAFKVDNTAPALDSFVITPDLGLSGTDLISSASDYTVNAQINEIPVQVTLALNGVPFPVVTLDAVGLFARDLNLAEGVHLLTLTVVDYAGNQMLAEKTLTVDQTEPGPCQNLAIAPDSGTPGDLLTSAWEITLTGVLPEFPLQVELLVNGNSRLVQMFAESTALSLPVVLTADGDYQLTLRCTDFAGNATESSLNVRVDSQAPALPVDLNMTPDTGTAGDWRTQLPDAQQLTIAGTLPEKLLQVRIVENEQLLAAKDCSGDEQDFALAFALAEGLHSLLLRISDPAGNSSERTLDVVIDNTAPAVLADLAVSPDTGRSDSDKITSPNAENPLVLNATLPESGLHAAWFCSTAEAPENLQPLGTQQFAEADGTLFRQSLPVLPDGQYQFTLRLTDAAGNSSDSLLASILLDSTAPAAAAALVIAPDTGIAGDLRTQLPQAADLTFSGTLSETLLQVEVLEGEAVLAEHTCAGAEQAFALAFPLPEGEHTLTVRLTDVAGNILEENHLVVIDNTAPGEGGALSIAPNTGNAADFITQLPADNPLTLSGSLPEPLLTVQVFEGENLLGEKVAAGEDQSFTFDFLLVEGVHDLRICTTDKAGNSTEQNLTVTIDNTAPAEIAGLAISPDAGLLPADRVTCLAQGQTLTLTGILPELPCTVQVLAGETSVADAFYDQAASSSLSLITTLSADGSYDLTVRTMDPAGNVREQALTVVLDSSAPAAVAQPGILPDSGESATDRITRLAAEENLQLTGTLPELPGRLEVFLAAAPEAALGTLQRAQGDDQEFSLALPALREDGVYSLLLRFTDLAGNSTDSLLVVQIDNTAPAQVAGLAVAPDTGRSDSDRITSPTAENPLVLRGTLPELPLHLEWFTERLDTGAGPVSLTSGTYLEGDGTAMTREINLEDGPYNLLVRLTDAAGNTSDTTLEGLLIDTVAPALLTDLNITPDTGTAGDFLTMLPEGEKLRVDATLPEDLLEVEILEETTRAVLAGKTCIAGDRTVDLEFPLAEGRHELLLRLTDVAGNRSENSLSVVIDNTPPAAASALAILPDHGEFATDNVTCLLAGETLSLSVTVAEVPLTLYLAISPDGTREFMGGPGIEFGPDDDLTRILPLEIEAGGLYRVQVRVVDPAGNSAESELQFELDTTLPTAVFSALPDNPSAEDELLITFNAPVVEAAMIPDILMVTYNGQPVTGLALEKVSPEAYRLSGLKAFALNARADGGFVLTLDLSQVSKRRSGLPGQGTAGQNWQFLFDWIEEFAWQPGWNTLLLNFSSLTTAAEEALQAMPRMRYDAAQKTFVRQQYLELAVPIWVFCADAENTALPAGIRELVGSSPEEIPELTWFLFSPASRFELEASDGLTAWEWLNGKYVLTTILLPGHVYWIFSNP